MTQRTLSGARVVAAGGVIENGWVTLTGAVIGAVGDGEPPADCGPVEDLGGRWLAPGFVDLHVHGGGGVFVQSGERADVEWVADLHLRHGTTTMLASIAPASPAAMRAAVERIAELTLLPDVAGNVLGTHLEGPFVSPERCGALNPAAIRAADMQELDALLTAGAGTVHQVTVAPELAGAQELIRRIVAAGAVAAFGHTTADYATTTRAIDAGARLATHLFNAMIGLDHRAPGAAAAALADPRVVCELIADGAHVHDAIARLAFTLAGTERIALVTDAMAAAGAGDGRFELAGQEVDVRDGVARLRTTGALAGSTLTMDRAVRHAVEQLGLPLPEAIRAASHTPARVLGIEDRTGSIAPGKLADLVVLNGELQVEDVFLRGRRHGAAGSVASHNPTSSRGVA